jgi:hypothetical protein
MTTNDAAERLWDDLVDAGIDGYDYERLDEPAVALLRQALAAAFAEGKADALLNETVRIFDSGKALGESEVRRATVERIHRFIVEHDWGDDLPQEHDDWRDGESARDHILRHIDAEAER